MGVYGRFAEFYDLIYKEIVNYENETDAFEKIFKKFSRRKVKRVLDVGCGTGSHSLLLSKRGYSVTGIDLSKRMIELAKRKASNEEREVEFVVQDMRKLDLGKRFDCAVCAFGGFGYLLTGEDLVKFFASLRKHLYPNGMFIFEFWSVGGIRPSPYQTWSKASTPDFVLYRLSESNFDPQTNILTINFQFIKLDKNRSAETFNETHDVRCYTLPEVKKFLKDNRFDLVTALDWNTKDIAGFKPPERETFRILAVARKA